MPYGSLAARACIASAASYRSEEVPGKVWLIQDPLTDAQVRISVDADAALDADKGDVTLAFRGSSSAMDWIHNAIAAQTPLPRPHRSDVRVHTGFFQQYISLHYQICDLLAKLGAKHVLLCGHSLGGALATIAVAMLPNKYTCDLATFGSPRAGNALFAEIVRTRCVRVARVVNDRDVVTTAPLRLMGYEHVVGDWLLLILPDASITIVDKPRSLVQELWLRACGVFSADFGISDHFITAYLAGLPETQESIAQETIAPQPKPEVVESATSTDPEPEPADTEPDTEPQTSQGETAPTPQPEPVDEEDTSSPPAEEPENDDAAPSTEAAPVDGEPAPSTQHEPEDAEEEPTPSTQQELEPAGEEPAPSTHEQDADQGDQQGGQQGDQSAQSSEDTPPATE